MALSPGVTLAGKCGQPITIAAIRVLDSWEQGRLQDVPDHIAYDRDYYMPERRQGLYL